MENDERDTANHRIARAFGPGSATSDPPGDRPLPAREPIFAPKNSPEDCPYRTGEGVSPSWLLCCARAHCPVPAMECPLPAPLAERTKIEVPAEIIEIRPGKLAELGEIVTELRHNVGALEHEPVGIAPTARGRDAEHVEIPDRWGDNPAGTPSLARDVLRAAVQDVDRALEAGEAVRPEDAAAIIEAFGLPEDDSRIDELRKPEPLPDPPTGHTKRPRKIRLEGVEIGIVSGGGSHEIIDPCPEPGCRQCRDALLARPRPPSMSSELIIDPPPESTSAEPIINPEPGFVEARFVAVPHQRKNEPGDGFEGLEEVVLAPDEAPASCPLRNPDRDVSQPRSSFTCALEGIACDVGLPGPGPQCPLDASLRAEPEPAWPFSLDEAALRGMKAAVRDREDHLRAEIRPTGEPDPSCVKYTRGALIDCETTVGSGLPPNITLDLSYFTGPPGALLTGAARCEAMRLRRRIASWCKRKLDATIDRLGRLVS